MLNLPNTIYIPAKTYLIGEYVALDQGPALILTHTPKFVCKNNQDRLLSNFFHPSSPAGKLLSHYQAANISGEWYDPFNGSGGFGGSGAEFIACYCLIKNLTIDQIDPWKIRDEYLNLIRHDGMILPSGYDLISQLQKNIAYIEARNKICINQIWPFDDTKILILKTKIKTSTHNHLNNFKLDKKNMIELELCANKAIQSFVNHDNINFFNLINQYHELLNKNNLVHKDILPIIKTIRSNQDVLAVKGCGALSSDVILVIMKNSKILNKILDQLSDQMNCDPKNSIQNLIGIDLNIIAVI